MRSSGSWLARLATVSPLTKRWGSRFVLMALLGLAVLAGILYFVGGFKYDTAKANGGTVQFVSNASNISEAVTLHGIPISQTQVSPNDTTVSYSVTGGTATGGGVDYTLNSGTVVIPAGKTSASIPITIVNDSITEPIETVVITLSSPSNAVLGSNSTHTLSILDDDTDSYSPTGGRQNAIPVTSGMVAWYRADAGVSLNSSSQVIGWADQSGNGNNATQSSSSLMPGFVANGANNLPAISFNGSQQMSVADSSSLKISGDMTFFAVNTYAAFASGNNNALFSKGPSAAGNNYTFGKRSSQLGFAYIDNSTRSLSINTFTTGNNDTSQYSWVVNKSATPKTVQFFSNGAAVGTTTDANNLNYSATSTTGATIGSVDTNTGERLNGNISEMILFNRALSAEERSQVECYLGSKYNLSVANCATAPEVWLRADAGVTADGSNKVSAWTDQSSNASNASQTTAANQPTLVSNVLNGKPVVRFDGSTSFMDIADKDDLDMLAKPKSAWIVGKANSYSGYPAFFSKENGYNTQGYNVVLDATNGKLRSLISTDPGVYTYPSSPDLTQNYNIMAVNWARQTSTQGYVNGTNVGSDTNGYPTTVFNNSLTLRLGRAGGGFNWLNGDIAELLLTNTTPTTVTRTQVDNYLSLKYGITISNNRYAQSAATNNLYLMGAESDGRISASANSGGMQVSDNGSSLGNGEYVAIAHDGATGQSTQDLPDGVISRWNRVWGLEKTSVDGVSAKLSFDFSRYAQGLPQTASNYRLLYRSGSSGAFSVVSNASTAVTGDQVDFTLQNADLVNGYYTIGTINASSQLSAPAPVSNLSATGSTDSAILNWSAPQSAVTDYIIQYSTDNFVQDITTFNDGVSTATSNISVTGLRGNTTYAFRVLTVNQSDTSLPSNVATATPSYSVPTITSVSPNSGATNGGNTVTVTGTNFIKPYLAREITINNTGGAKTDYLVMATLDTASLISAGQMRSDCGDIRAYDTNLTTSLSFWLESGCNTGKTNVLVKVPSIAASSVKKVYLTFSDSSRTSASSLDNTAPALKLSTQKLWVKANGGTNTTTDGQNVTSWADQSPNGFNLTVQSGYSAGTYVANSANGQPGIRLAANRSYQMPSRITDIRSGFWVFKETAYNTAFLLGDNSSYDFHRGNNAIWNSSYASASIQSGTTRLNGTAVNGTTTTPALNTTNLISLVTTGNVQANTINEDRTSQRGLVGEFNEIILFSTALSNSQVSQIENYLNSKYALATNVTVSVANYALDQTVVKFNNTPATSVTYISSTQLQVTVPPSPLSNPTSGAVNVSVNNPNTTSSTLTNGYTYAPPFITSLTPSTIPSAGGTEVTLTGGNFYTSRYKRDITISSTTNQTNYRAPVTLDTASLIAVNKMRSDCGDIRFYDSDGVTQLNYWLESGCNTGSTIVWFAVPSVTANVSKTIYISYGVSGNTSQSSIGNVFPIFSNANPSYNFRLWLKANDGTGATSDGAGIAQWSDMSGGGNHATQGNNYNQPTYQSNVVNGRPVLRFDGVNDTLSTTNSIGLQSIFAVANHPSNTGGNFPTYNGLFTGLTSNIGFIGNSGTTSIYPGSFSTYYVNGTQTYAFSPLQTFKYLSATSTSVFTEGWKIGQDRNISSRYWNGDVAEIIGFGSQLSTTDRQEVENYLNAKYRLSGTLPTVSMAGESQFSGEFQPKVTVDTTDVPVTYVNPTTLKFIAPAHAAGQVNVTIVNPDGSNSTNINALTYQAPSVSSASPSSGPNSGGTYVTITGSGFSNYGSGPYRRVVKVENTSGSAISNYIGFATLDSSSLISSGKMRSDCGDVRVKDQDGSTDLPFYTDGCGTGRMGVWFKISSLQAGIRHIVITYGSPGLTSASSVSNTFAAVGNANAKLWLKANDGTGVSSLYSAVSTWTDRSSSGNNATQATSANQAWYIPNALNGYPVLRFDNTDNYTVANPAQFNIATPSLFVVGKSTGSNGYMGKNTTTTSGSGRRKLQLGISGFVSGADGSSFTIPGSNLNTYALTESVSFANNNHKAGTNGTVSTIITSLDLSTFNTDNLRISNPFGNNAEMFTGDIAEILIYNSALSDSNRAEVEQYLGQKYNLWNSAPAGTTATLGREQSVSVSFNGQQAYDVDVLNSTTIRAYAPAGSGSASVIVTGSNGVSNSANTAYTYGSSAAPNPVTDLVLSSTDTGTATLNWSTPANNGSPITDYAITYSTDPGFASPTTFNDGVSTATTTTVTGLNVGTTYYFRVAAVSSLGTSGTGNTASGMIDCDFNYNGADFTPANGSTISGRYCNVGTFTVSNGSTVNITYGTPLRVNATNIVIAGTLNGASRGFSGSNPLTNQGDNGLGSGAGVGGGCYNYSTGGGYGGEGGRHNTTSGGTTYGSATQPTDMGSGGGSACSDFGGNGGGAIKLIASSSASVTGTISVNGGNGLNSSQSGASSYAGGGSGGSVWIQTSTFSGNGTISAIGGDGGNTGNGGGGGGGRIALYYNTKTFSGSVTAAGGSVANQAGGAGTMYEKNNTSNQEFLTIDNLNKVGGTNTSNPTTPISSSSFSPNAVQTLSITNRANVVLSKDLSIANTTFDLNANTRLTNSANLTLSTATGMSLGASATFTSTGGLSSSSLTSLTTGSSSSMIVTGSWTAASLATVTLAGTLDVSNPTFGTINSMTIQSGGNLTHRANSTVSASPLYKLDLTLNSLTIDSGGKIDVTSRGYSGAIGTGQGSDGNGPGAGTGTSCYGSSSGGGYGGQGGRHNTTTGGSTYGSSTQPTDLGSGGGTSCSDRGGAGGGAVKLNVSGTLTNNGSIIANGGNSRNNNDTGNGTYSSGGSGGSIWIQTGTLAGNGAINANGGNNFNASYSGGGGGGRIALYYNSKTYTGTGTVSGGTGAAVSGSAGTIYEPNTPETNIPNATLSPNPNPPSVGANFLMQVTNIRNTSGFSLYSGTCSITVTGPSSYSQTISGGSVSQGTCTPPSSFAAPTATGTYTAAVTVVGSDVAATTTSRSITFTVFAAASNRAAANGTQPVYASLTPSPNPSLVQNTVTLTLSGLVDSGNSQTLNGIPCTFNVTAPNSFSQNFNSANVVGGSCSVTIPSASLPATNSAFGVTASVQGDSSTLITASVSFTRAYDIYLENPATPGSYSLTGKIPGSVTSNPNPIVYGGANPVYTSPVIKLFDNSTLVASGTPCANVMQIASLSPVTYASTINGGGQCVTTVPNTDLSAGNLTVKTTVTLTVNSTAATFETSPTTLSTVNFPSYRATAQTSPNQTQPAYTAQTATSPTFVGSSLTLTTSGLTDSVNAQPLLNATCNYNLTGPSNYTQTFTNTVSSGTCSITIPGTSLPYVSGNYTYSLGIQGDAQVLNTPQTGFTRNFDIYLVGGVIPGSVSSSQNPIFINTATTLTSPVIKRSNNSTNIATGTTCRNIVSINGGANLTFNGTVNSSGQCSTSVAGSNFSATGTAAVYTQISLFNSDYNSNYAFQTAATNFTIRYPNTAKICADPTFRDDNPNGTQDAGEPLLSGVTTRLRDGGTGTILNSLTTNGTGNNCFTSLYDGNYTLEQVTPSGGTKTIPSGASYPVTLNPGDTQNFTFGYNGNASICLNPTFVDLDANGSYGGSDYRISKLTRLYLSSDLNTVLDTLSTTSTTGSTCFTNKTPGNYTIEQDIPQSGDTDFPNGGTPSVSGMTTSGTKARRTVTLSFGSNQTGVQFGYSRNASQKASAQASPNQTKPAYTAINFSAVVGGNTVANKVYKGYKFQVAVTGLTDSGTLQPLSIPGNAACSMTFSGPSFSTPQTNYGTVSNGTCLIDPTPDSAGTGNTATLTIAGDSGNLTASSTFTVLSGSVNICFNAFADYNKNGAKASTEPFLSGLTTTLATNNGATILQTVTSSGSGNTCFTAVDPGVAYQITQTAPTGGVATTNSGYLTYSVTPNPEDALTYAFGYKGNATICPTSWRDDNQNQTRDTNQYGQSEPLISGVLTSNLLDVNSTPISSFTVDNSTCITELLPGLTYTLSQTFSSSLKIGRTTFTGGSTSISDLGSGETRNVAFGYYNTASICPNPTFGDFNADGAKQSTEPYLNGIPTNLILVSDSSTRGTLNSSSSNCFQNVIPGSYQVAQTPITGYISTTGGSTQSITASLGTDATLSFGYKGNATICPYPTFQDNNSNGTQDAGESSINGLATALRDAANNTLLSLTTDGSSCFTNVLPQSSVYTGSYNVVQTAPSGGTSTTGGSTRAVNNIQSGQTVNLSFGYNGNPRICPYVFRDDNNNGTRDNGEIRLSGATVTLKDNAGNPVTSFTSSTASQCFGPLSLGNYTVEVTSPSGYIATTTLTRSLILTFGVDQNPDFGFYGSATVCIDRAFRDYNSDGIYNNSDTAYSGLASYIKITSTNTALQTKTSDANGQVCFDPVPPNGNGYTVYQDAPSGSVSTTGGAQNLILAPGDSKTVKFGYNGSGTVCPNPTFNDANFDGAKNTGETFLSGVVTRIYLQSDTATALQTISTDSGGANCFTNLFPGNYQVQQDAPSGYSATTGATTRNFTLAAGGIQYLTYGYTNDPAFNYGFVRGFLYVDRNENGAYDANGQDNNQITVFDNDVPVTQQEVQLWKKNPVSNQFEQNTSIITGTDGTYQFLNLGAGDYEVRIPTPQGTTPVNPSPSTRAFTITSGAEHISGQDFSFQYTAKICPSLFVDKNNNGNYDPDGDDGNPATTFDNDVNLLASAPGAYFQLQYTSFNGTQTASNYNSSGFFLNAGNPCITKVPPRTYTLVMRSDLANALGYGNYFNTSFYNQRTTNPSITIFLGTESYPTMRYYSNNTASQAASTVTGRVWNNRPARGQGDVWSGGYQPNGADGLSGTSAGYNRDFDNDFGYSGIRLQLYKCGDGLDDPYPTATWNASPPQTTTASDGTYTFSNVTPGVYAVVRMDSLPNQSALTNLPTNSCDIFTNYIRFNNNPNQTYSSQYTPGQTATYDIQARFGGKVNNAIYHDQNRNGQYDTWETNRDDLTQKIGGTFLLKDVSGNILDSASSTDNFSGYASSGGFLAVPPGSYSVDITSVSNNPGYSAISVSIPTTMSVQETDQNYFGFTPTTGSTLSGQVFIDRNGNNVLQTNGADNNAATTFDNDAAVPGATIELYYGRTLNAVPAQLVATTTSDANGNYSFPSLPEGYYSARITSANPAGIACTRCDWGYASSSRYDVVYINKDEARVENLRYQYDGKITVKAFYDAYANGLRDTQEIDASGMQFTLTAPDGTTLSAIGPNSAFSNLPPGTYTINVINIPSGTGTTGGFTNSDGVTLIASQQLTRDYAFTPYTNNTLQGDVFVDRGTLNNTYDPNGADGNAALTFDNELAFSGATVKIIGPGNTTYTATTNASGRYVLNNLPSANYKVHTYADSDTSQNSPIFNVTLNNNLSSAVKDECVTGIPFCRRNSSLSTLLSGITLTNADSKTSNYTYLYTNTVQGQFYDDVNGDGLVTTYPDINYTETLISGTSMQLQTPTGEILPCSGTYVRTPGFDSRQYCQWDYLPPGDYVFSKTANLSGRTNSGLSRVDAGTINYGPVDQKAFTFSSAAINQNAYFRVFQYIPPTTNNATITGKVFTDRNEDGYYQANGSDGLSITLEDNDSLLSGIGLSLNGTSSGGIGIVRNTTTATDGKYQFTDLPAGTYTITASFPQ